MPMADGHNITYGGEKENLKTTKTLQKIMFKSSHFVENNVHSLVVMIISGVVIVDLVDM